MAALYILVYENEVVLPSKVEIHSLRIIQKAKLSNDEWVCSCYEQLILISEKAIVDIRHGQLYQQRMICAFNEKVKAQMFEVGQFVLRCIFSH